jgi:hypothetical protein
MMTTWKDIPSILGYEVSDSGVVRNKETGHEMAQRVSWKYLSTTVKHKDYRVHRLVAEAFCEKSEGKHVVNHKDGNKMNNHADNLEWCNKSENEKHAYATGLKASTDYHKQQTRLSNYARRMLPVEAVHEIKQRQLTQNQLAEKHNCSRQLIGMIQQNQRYADIGA